MPTTPEQFDEMNFTHPATALFRTADYSLQLLEKLKPDEPITPLVFVGEIPVWLSPKETTQSIIARCAKTLYPRQHTEQLLADEKRRVVQEMAWSKPYPNQTVEGSKLLLTEERFPSLRRASIVGLYELILQIGKAGFQEESGGDVFLVSARFGSPTHILIGVCADSYGAAKRFVRHADVELGLMCNKAGILKQPLEFPK